MAAKRIPKEYLGAFKAGHRASSREFIDDGLSLKLLKKAQAGCEESKRTLEWITKFNNEYYKGVVKKGDVTALHFKDDKRRECYNRNNRQREDVYWRKSIFKKTSGF